MLGRGRESSPVRPGSVEFLGVGVLGTPTPEHQPWEIRDPEGAFGPPHFPIAKSLSFTLCPNSIPRWQCAPPFPRCTLVVALPAYHDIRLESTPPPPRTFPH